MEGAGAGEAVRMLLRTPDARSAKPQEFIPEHWPKPATYAPSVCRQYRLALYDEEGDVIQGARFMYASDETPYPASAYNSPEVRGSSMRSQPRGARTGHRGW
jgi:hypothetical protein